MSLWKWDHKSLSGGLTERLFKLLWKMWKFTWKHKLSCWQLQFRMSGDSFIHNNVWNRLYMAPLSQRYAFGMSFMIAGFLTASDKLYIRKWTHHSAHRSTATRCQPDCTAVGLVWCFLMFGSTLQPHHQNTKKRSIFWITVFIPSWTAQAWRISAMEHWSCSFSLRHSWKYDHQSLQTVCWL